MKPTYTEPNYLLNGVADTEEQINQLTEGKSLNPETNLRAYKSAAVIGLAISLGASGVLLPRQGDEAIAAEPFTVRPAASTLGTGLNSSPESNQPPTVQSSTQESKVTTEAVEPSSPVVISPVKATVYHQVTSGDTFWLLAQKYQISADAIAQANNLDIKATLTVGQSLKIPTTNTIHAIQLGEITEANSPTYGVSKAQLQNISTSANTPATIPVNIQGAANPETAIQSRQNEALQNLRGQRDQLREALGGWRIERTANQNFVNQNNLVASIPSQPSPVPISGWGNNSQASRQVSEQAIRVIASVQESPTQEFSVANNQNAATTTSNTSTSVATPENSATNAAKPDFSSQISNSAVTPPAPMVITTPSLPNAGSANWTNNSPRTATTSNWVATNPEPVSGNSPTVFAAIPSTPVLPSVMIQELPASAPEVHQVRPGETLDAIARRYGISRQELVRVNRISNPNLLFVDQRLTIPANPARAISSAPTAANIPQKAGNSYDASAVNPAPTITVAALPQPTPGGIFGSSSGNPAPIINSSTTQLTQDELVTERLRADIRRMREEHQQQRTSQPILTNQNQLPTASLESRPLFTNNSGTNNSGTSNSGGLERVNPQFRAASTETASPALPAQPQLVAVAPSSTGALNPMLQLPIGQVVSPDLPPLSAADTYLPSSPARFDGYIWPAEGVLTSGYGMRWGRMHRGIDIAAPTGTPIMAAAPGVVVTAGWNDGGYGNLVEIKHPDGSLTLYAHNNRVLVQEGQQVAQGEQIAEMGSTGFSTGPHLHFEIHPTGRGAVNPVALMPRE